MKSLLLLIVMLAISGCAGMDFEPKRWTEGDTFYSTKLPSIQVKVEMGMQPQKSTRANKLVDSVRGSSVTGQETTWFYFYNDKTIPPKEELNIKIETLKAHDRWYMMPPDYGQYPNSLSSGEKILSGIRFNTGIFVVDKKTYAFLIKGYGRVVGETTRFQIFYLERVERDWLEKNPKWLTREDADFLASFNQRAKTSFSISKYDGTPHPDQHDSTESIVDQTKKNNAASRHTEKEKNNPLLHGNLRNDLLVHNIPSLLADLPIENPIILELKEDIKTRISGDCDFYAIIEDKNGKNKFEIAGTIFVENNIVRSAKTINYNYIFNLKNVLIRSGDEDIVITKNNIKDLFKEDDLFKEKDLKKIFDEYKTSVTLNKLTKEISTSFGMKSTTENLENSFIWDEFEKYYIKSSPLKTGDKMFSLTEKSLPKYGIEDNNLEVETLIIEDEVKGVKIISATKYLITQLTLRIAAKLYDEKENKYNVINVNGGGYKLHQIPNLFSSKYVYTFYVNISQFNIAFGISFDGNLLTKAEVAQLPGGPSAFGIVKSYYESGNIMVEEHYNSGKRNGFSKEYYESGALMLEGTYQNNKKRGYSRHILNQAN